MKLICPLNFPPIVCVTSSIVCTGCLRISPVYSCSLRGVPPLFSVKSLSCGRLPPGSSRCDPSLAGPFVLPLPAGSSTILEKALTIKGLDVSSAIRTSAGLCSSSGPCIEWWSVGVASPAVTRSQGPLYSVAPRGCRDGWSSPRPTPCALVGSSWEGVSCVLGRLRPSPECLPKVVGVSPLAIPESLLPSVPRRRGAREHSI